MCGFAPPVQGFVLCGQLRPLSACWTTTQRTRCRRPQTATSAKFRFISKPSRPKIHSRYSPVDRSVRSLSQPGSGGCSCRWSWASRVDSPTAAGSAAGSVAAAGARWLPRAGSSSYTPDECHSGTDWPRPRTGPLGPMPEVASTALPQFPAPIPKCPSDRTGWAWWPHC